MSNNQQILKQAIQTGDIGVFNDAVQKVALSQIPGLGIDDEIRLAIRPLIKNFTVPVNVSYKTHTETPETALTGTPYVRGIICFLLVIIALILQSFVGWWSALICLILIAGYMYFCKANCTQNLRQEVIPVIEAEPNDVMSKIDSFINIIRIASTQNQTENDKSSLKRQSLFEEFPNIVRWFQNIYASKDEFDEDGRKYLFKSIPRLLNQLYYKVVMYDGQNINLFEVDVDSFVNGTELIYPAIVDTRSNKVVLKGKVCNP